VRGLATAGAVWFVAILVAREIDARTARLPSLTLDRQRFALTLLLLATHAIAGSTSAEELLENPVVLERVVRGGLAGLAALVVLPAFARGMPRTVTRPWRAVLGITGYVGVAAISVLYSVAPVVTAGKVFELLVAMMIVASCLGSDTPSVELRRMIKFVLYLEGTLLLTALAGFFLLPSLFAQVQTRPGFVFTATMAAPYAHPNVLAATGGALAAYGLASFFAASDRHARRGWMALYVASTIAIVLSSGRQGVVIWVCVTAVLLATYRRKVLFTLIVPATAVVMTWFGEEIWRALNRDAFYNLRTLTGRLSWWQSAIQVWTDHAWTGYGFGAGGRFVALAAIGSRASNVHSGYLEALVGVGLLGLLPFGFALLVTGLWVVGCLRRRIDVPYAILLLPLALHTAVDLGFGAWLKPDFVIVACLAGMADLAHSKRAADPEVAEHVPELAVSRI
jgi:O-antigen ligase